MGFFKKRLNSIIKSLLTVLLFIMTFLTQLGHKCPNSLSPKQNHAHSGRVCSATFLEMNQWEGTVWLWWIYDQKAQFEIYSVSVSTFKTDFWMCPCLSPWSKSVPWVYVPDLFLHQWPWKYKRMRYLLYIGRLQLMKFTFSWVRWQLHC